MTKCIRFVVSENVILNLDHFRFIFTFIRCQTGSAAPRNPTTESSRLGSYNLTDPFCPIKILLNLISILVGSRSCLGIDATSQPADC